LTVYRLYGVGDEIDLDVAERCLAKSTSGRAVVARARQSESIQVVEPPLRATFGPLVGQLGTLHLEGRLRASIYDLGVVVLAWESRIQRAVTWAEVAHALNGAADPPQPLADHFRTVLTEVEGLIGPAIKNQNRVNIVEDYSVLFVERLVGRVEAASLAESPEVLAAALGEWRSLSSTASDLVTRMSYYPDDLALMSWTSAILIDPDPLASAAAADLIEFAEVELLVLRIYDAELEADLPGMYRQMARAERRFRLPLGAARKQLHAVQRLVAEVTEVTERLDNALKVTDDVYWNRLYSAALSVLRVQVWRTGVEHKLALLRETYAMLRSEADAERDLTLELAIVLLIIVEVVLAIWRPAT
jgi:hypothetical protein